MNIYDDYPYDLSADEYCFLITLGDRDFADMTNLLDSGYSFMNALDEYNLVGEYWE